MQFQTNSYIIYKEWLSFSFLTSYYVLSYCIGKTFQSLSNNNGDSFLDLKPNSNVFPNLFSLAGLFTDPQYLTYSGSLIDWHSRINRSLYLLPSSNSKLWLHLTEVTIHPYSKQLQWSHSNPSFIYNCGECGVK